MSEDEVQAKLTNLENDVATLQGENDRLNSELALRDIAIDELKDVQKSLEEQVKAAHEETRKSMEIASSSEQLEQLKADKEKQASHIIDLENKLKMYQDFESSRVAMEKQLTEIEQKSQKHLQELVEAKASHELEVKSLKEQIIKLSQQEADYNPGWDKLIDLQIVIKAADEPEEVDFVRDEQPTLELSEKNTKLKKKLIQEKKVNKKMLDEMETMKSELYELHNQNDNTIQIGGEEFANLQNEIQEKNDYIDVLENTNRELEVKLNKAEDEARQVMIEMQNNQDQNDAIEGKFGDQDEQIAQMHEDMQRLLEFKNELEALIEEQNKDIEEKTQKINYLVEELEAKSGELEGKDAYLKNLEKQVKEYKTKFNSVNSKYNRMKQGKVAELQKKIRDLTSEIEILKEMVKSSKKEMHSKEISIKKFKKRMTSLEKIAKFRSKASEINSSGSRQSQRNRSVGRQGETYEYDTHEDSHDYEGDQVIVEAEENLEHTGPQDPYYIQNQKLNQYSKTPNVRVSKNLNNSKVANLERNSPERLRADNSMPKMGQRDPFRTKVKKGYEMYKESLDKPGFKNNSYGMKGVFAASDQFELPVIKESQKAVIFDKKRLDNMRRDNDDTKSTANISNTYKQSYNIF